MGKVITSAGEEFSPENVHRLILYDAPASPCSRRCRITLLEKGLDWDTVNLNLGNMEQRSPAYLAINPNGFVPSLAHGSKVVFESGVINTYLENQFPEVRLLPQDAAGIAKVRMWQSAELAMAKIFRPLMYQLTAGPIKRISRTEEENEAITRLETDQASDLAWERKIYRMEVLKPHEVETHKQWLMDWLTPLEGALKDCDYLVNNKFSQADIAVFPRLQMYAGLGLDVSADDYPNLHRWMAALEPRHSFIHSQDEQARKYMAMTRSPMMQKLREFFATPESERTEETKAEIREFGKNTRERLGIDRVLTAAFKGRKLPQPCEGKIPSDQKDCVAVRSEAPRDLTLYGNSLSPHSQRICLLLNYLGRNFEYVEIDLAANENRSDDFLKLNPLGEVPVLRSDGFVIYDSQAIAEFLCNSLPDGSLLMPDKSFYRAEHDMWLALESGTHKEFTPLLHEVMFAESAFRRADIDPVQRAGFVERIRPKLAILEARLDDSDFLTADSISYADIAWYSRISSVLESSIADLINEYPAILGWHEKVTAELRSA